MWIVHLHSDLCTNYRRCVKQLHTFWHLHSHLYLTLSSSYSTLREHFLLQAFCICTFKMRVLKLFAISIARLLYKLTLSVLLQLWMTLIMVSQLEFHTFSHSFFSHTDCGLISDTLLDEIVLRFIWEHICASSGDFVMTWIYSSWNIQWKLNLIININQLQIHYNILRLWIQCYCIQNCKNYLKRIVAKVIFFPQIETNVHELFVNFIVPLSSFSDFCLKIWLDLEIPLWVCKLKGFSNLPKMTILGIFRFFLKIWALVKFEIFYSFFIPNYIFEYCVFYLFVIFYWNLNCFLNFQIGSPWNPVLVT